MRRVDPGAALGGLLVPVGAAAPTIRFLSYGPETLEEGEAQNARQIASLQGRNPVTWINVDGLEDA